MSATTFNEEATERHLSSGVTKWDRNSPRTKLIEIDESLYDSGDQIEHYRLRFTLGHEYFHAIEHLELAKNQFRTRAEMNRVAFSEEKKPVEKKKLETNEDWQEWQANQFAAEILMPHWSLRQIVSVEFGGSVFDTDDNNTTKEHLARQIGNHRLADRKKIHQLFGVSNQAMAFRLMDLGIVV